MADQTRAPMTTTEQVAIKLPVSVAVIGRIGELIGEEWPGSVVLTEHDHGPEFLVIEIRDVYGEAGEDD